MNTYWAVTFQRWFIGSLHVQFDTLSGLEGLTKSASRKKWHTVLMDVASPRISYWQLDVAYSTVCLVALSHLYRPKKTPCVFYSWSPWPQSTSSSMIMVRLNPVTNSTTTRSIRGINTPFDCLCLNSWYVHRNPQTFGCSKICQMDFVMVEFE